MVRPAARHAARGRAARARACPHREGRGLRHGPGRLSDRLRVRRRHDVRRPRIPRSTRCCSTRRVTFTAGRAPRASHLRCSESVSSSRMARRQLTNTGGFHGADDRPSGPVMHGGGGGGGGGNWSQTLWVWPLPRQVRSSWHANGPPSPSRSSRVLRFSRIEPSRLASAVDRSRMPPVGSRLVAASRDVTVRRTPRPFRDTDRGDAEEEGT